MAGLWYLFSVCLLWLLASYGDGQSVITMTPSSLSLTPSTSDDGGVVTVRCQTPPLGAGDQLFVLSIARQLENEGTFTTIASTTAQNPDAVMTVSIPGAIVSGGITDGFITVILTQAKCGDTGIYRCSSSVFSSGNPQQENSVRNLTVEVRPGQITLTADPSGKTKWVVNETVRILCNAPVGTVEQNTEVVWLWGYRDNSGGFGSSWQVYEVDADIDRDVDRTPLTCYERRSSRLTRRLTLEDNEREYRCYISRGGQPYQQYAATFSVGTVTVGQEETNTPSEGTQVSPYMVIAVSAGVMLVILIIVIAVVIVWLWRRQWILPCAGKPSTTSSESIGRDMSEFHNYVEASSRAPDQPPSDQPSQNTSPSGPYNTLQQSDVGLRSVYMDMNDYIHSV